METSKLDNRDDFKDVLTSDLRLNVKPMRESEYYDSQSTIVYNRLHRPCVVSDYVSFSVHANHAENRNLSEKLVMRG